MEQCVDILISISISILYVFFIQKISEMTIKDLEYNERIQKEIIISLIGGIVGYIIAIYLLEIKKYKIKNKAVKYGILLGSTFIIINALIFNWLIIDNDIKLFIIGCLLIFFIFISYKMNEKTEYE